MWPVEVCWSRPPQIRPISARLGLEKPFRAVYLSDLHCAPWSNPMLRQLEPLIHSLAPQAILLGGDLIDLPWGYSNLTEWVQRLLPHFPVLAVPGNHDRWAGLARLRRSLPGVHWLDQQPYLFRGGPRFCGCSRQESSASSILVGHEPTAVRLASRRGFPLMLAGHLHGCQWIAFQRQGLDYPGAWFFAYHGGHFQVGPTSLYVSRGVSDTLPVRINCPRDVLLLEVA